MLMLRILAAASLTLATAACSGQGSEPDVPSTVVSPVNLPPGTPASYAERVDAADLSPEALVPAGTVPSELWPVVAPDDTQFVLVAFEAPRDDPLRQPRGLIVWRRFDDAPPWRPILGISDEADAGVVQIRATIGDATGDGYPDALTFEDTGGSGACGIWRVLDLAANSQVFQRRTCDTTIELSADPVGLSVREAVFEEGDAHCCPSSFTVSILEFGGSPDWSVLSTTEQPA